MQSRLVAHTNCHTPNMYIHEYGYTQYMYSLMKDLEQVWNTTLA